MHNGYMGITRSDDSFHVGTTEDLATEFTLDEDC